MIKFFRKIRRKLLTENKFSKYLIYAIGEIFLVMIGIFLALQLNTWNDTKVKTRKEITNLKEININLKGDLENQIIPGYDYYKISIKVYNILQSNFYESAQRISEDSIRKLFFKMVLPWNLAFNTVAFDNLGSTDLISNDLLRKNISNLYGYEYKIIMDYHNITITELREDFVPLLFNNLNLFKVLSVSQLNYLKNDNGINARLTGMMYRRNSLKNYFLQIQPVVEQIILDIENEVKRLEEEYNLHNN